jgi:hypothetical protein
MVPSMPKEAPLMMYTKRSDGASALAVAAGQGMTRLSVAWLNFLNARIEDSFVTNECLSTECCMHLCWFA